MIHKHWIEQIAEKIIENKKEPFVIGSGVTVSGPLHWGTLCEVLYPEKIKETLVKRGFKAKHNFIADVLDAFDKIPIAMIKYEKELKEHLGKPLINVPDPTGTSKSLGEYFLNEYLEIFEKFDIYPNVIKVDSLYKDGKYDIYAVNFMNKRDKVKEIIEKSSGKTEKKDWYPIMPICKNCGKIATTRVKEWNNGRYNYVCDKVIDYTKGCGYEGEDEIKNHNYKLVWRLDWPTRLHFLKTSCEGGSVDHFTKGGSRDTLEAIFREFFNEEPPIGFKFGFILAEGKKYSKSKGTGISIKELLTILPPSVIEYILLKYDIEENKDIVPTKETLIRMIEDFESAERVLKLNNNKVDQLERAERKKVIAFLLSGSKKWNAEFRDILMLHAIYQDWDKVGILLNDKEGIAYLKPYLEEWKKRDLIPNEYNFVYSPKKAEGKIKEFFFNLREDMDAKAIHNFVFNFARENSFEPKEFFRLLYLTLIGKESGPPLGKFIYAIGINRVKKDVL